MEDQQKKKESGTEKVNRDLHPYMANLVDKLEQEFRFGEVIVVMQDGVPMRIKKVKYSINLGIAKGKKNYLQKEIDMIE